MWRVVDYYRREDVDSVQYHRGEHFACVRVFCLANGSACVSFGAAARFYIIVRA